MIKNLLLILVTCMLGDRIYAVQPFVDAKVSWVLVQSLDMLNESNHKHVAIGERFSEWGKLSESTTINSLQALDLSRASWSDISQLPLHKCTSLKLLKLPTGSTGHYVIKLASVTTLEEVHLPGTFATDQDVAQLLAKSKALHSLDLVGSVLLRGNPFAGVKPDKLRHISVARCTGITAEGITDIAKFETLTSFDCAQCEITDNDLALLTRCTSLEWLALAGCSRLTGLGLKLLSKLQRLSVLNLSFLAQLDNDDYCSIADVTALTHLTAAGTKVADQSITSILKRARLEFLDLANCPNIRGTFLADQSVWIDGLKCLVLSNCPLAKGALGALADVKIDTIDLSGVDNFTHVALADLYPLRHLSKLRIARTDFVDFPNEPEFAGNQQSKQST